MSSIHHRRALSCSNPSLPHHRTVWPAEFANGLPKVTRDQLDYRVARLARPFGLGVVDAEDVRSMFLAELYRGLARFDPSKASATTFACQILNRAFVIIAQKLRRECRIRKRQRSLDEVVEELRYDAKPSSTWELACTFEGATLTPAESALLFDLARMSAADAARHRDVSAGTVSRRLKAVRLRLDKSS
jgi:DNA-directed RNA polymerase specialized sigma24 family protein